jgi:hypothetical protein
MVIHFLAEPQNAQRRSTDSCTAAPRHLRLCVRMNLLGAQVKISSKGEDNEHDLDDG